MKYRVMTSDGTVTDFEKDKEGDARTLYASKKKLVEKAKIVDDIVPFCSLHICHHGEIPLRRCEPIERFEKQPPISISSR